MDQPKKSADNTFSAKKIALWMLLFVLIALISIRAVTAQSADLSFSDFIEYAKSADPVYLILALVSMLCFVIFEGLAVVTICKAMGYPRGFKSSFVYSASDIYFSAITPSATGGQPASVWFMAKDGIPVTTSVVALVSNLVLYTISIVLIGGITFICAPGLFLGLTSLSKILIVVGYIIMTLLAGFFILILFKGNIVYAVLSGIIKLLTKMKIIKNPDKINEKLSDSLKQYQVCAELVFKKKRAICVAFVFNFLQRASQITVTALAYLAVGGEWENAAQAWFAQAYAVIGSNMVPIPGAMGVSDYLLLNGLETFVSSENAVKLELLSRAMSFYSMIAICGIAILVKYVSIVKKSFDNKGET